MVQIGFSYDCLLESTFTGYLLQCKGWTSAYLYPKRPCFLGCSPVDMKDAMVQMLKWSSELFQVGFSKYSPLIYGISRMSILQSMSYAYFAFSSLLSVAFVLYGVVPQWGFLKGIPLYPKVRNKSLTTGSKKVILIRIFPLSFHIRLFRICSFQIHGLLCLLPY